jgi:hypothetical protein
MKLYQIFNDACPVCGSSEGYITFVWSTEPNQRTPSWLKGHEIMTFTCRCGTRTVIERLPIITKVMCE